MATEIRMSPSQPQFRAAWELAGLALLEVLKREPTADEIAARVQADPELRWIAGKA